MDSGDIVVVGGGSGVCLTDELMACHGVFLSSNGIEHKNYHYNWTRYTHHRRPVTAINITA